MNILGKPEVMSFGKIEGFVNIFLEGKTIEQVNSFKYLRSKLNKEWKLYVGKRKKISVEKRFLENVKALWKEGMVLG